MDTNFDRRNAHFDRLVATPGLRWLGQNTNHIEPAPEVIEALAKSIADREYQFYAPPSGLEELRVAILGALGLVGLSIHVTDGAVSALYHTVKTLLAPGDSFVTTDPTWAWPLAFAREAGAEVTQIPIYGPEHGYRLAPERLAASMHPGVKVIYLVDPNNPLGTTATAEEIAEIARIARAAGAWLIQDCTYRDFAHEHHLAARFYPEGTITIYSCSKWLGLAGLRIGAVIAHPELMERITSAPPNNLGSNIIAQRAAIAGFKVKSRWFPQVLAITRNNQALIADAVAGVPGLSMPVHPSGGNFIIIECEQARATPEALCSAYRERGILIRQGSYHTPTFGHRFIKVSTSVPELWAVEFAALLPEMVERAKQMNVEAALY